MKDLMIALMLTGALVLIYVIAYLHGASDERERYRINNPRKPGS